MTMSLVLLAGVLLAAGLVCLVAAVMPAVPRLDVALERVGSDGPTARTATPDVGTVTRPSERLGALLYRVSPVPLSDRQRRALRLQDKPIAEFYADKAVMMIIGAVLPGLGAFLWSLGGASVGPWPALLSLAGAVTGFFGPDLLLRRAAETARSGAVEALLVYIDLVTLERLANASATQALHSAAQLSDGPLFLQIRTALDRARLEQQPPYGELRRIADQLQLPELADVADVMQLDETGAALSGTLRARVRELRDAHLTSEQTKASAAAEGMTIYMTLPALIFSLIFLVAAMLKIFFPETP
jgi:tight adherence protein C